MTESYIYTQEKLNTMSMYEKLGIMNGKGIALTFDPLLTEQKIGTNNFDLIWSIGEGHTESFIMKNMECLVSIDSMNINTPEVLEKMIDDNILLMDKIYLQLHRD